jgi:hypothetical protein
VTAGDAIDLRSTDSNAKTTSMTDDYYDTEAGLEAWADFWEEFDAAEPETRFELAREAVEDDPHFDGEFAFELARALWEGLPDEDDARHRYRESLEQVRQSTPQVAADQRGMLLYYELWATCLLDEPVEVDDVERLLDAFVDHPTPCDAAFDLLMYHGRADALANLMPDEWLRLREWTDRIGGLSAFAWLALALNLVRAAADDPSVRFEGTLVDRLAPVVAPERKDEARRLLDHLAGRSQVSPEELEADDVDAQIDAAVRLVAEHVGDLARREDWPWSRAVLAFDMFDEFYREHFAAQADEAPDSMPSESSTDLDTRLETASPVAFHPDEAALHLEQFAGRAFAPGHGRVAFVEALGPWIELLVERDLMTDELAETIRGRLREPLERALDTLFERDSDPRMMAQLRRALDELEK